MPKSIFETRNAQFFEDVEFVGEDKVMDFVFENECVTIPTVAIDNDHTSIPNIVYKQIRIKTMLKNLLFKIKKLL